MEFDLPLLEGPEHIQSVIRECSPQMNLLWNGLRANDFVPSRGVRQGDPLSPYLFVLAVERLGHLIQSEVDLGSCF